MNGRGGYTYILSNQRNDVLYIGVTSELFTRIWQHKKKEGSKFTSKYKCNKLVYFEFHDTIEAANHREKQLKKWKRAWKDDLINKDNRGWSDLWDATRNMD